MVLISFQLKCNSGVQCSVIHDNAANMKVIETICHTKLQTPYPRNARLIPNRLAEIVLVSSNKVSFLNLSSLRSSDFCTIANDVNKKLTDMTEIIRVSEFWL